MKDEIINLSGNIFELIICITFFSSVGKPRVSRKVYCFLALFFTICQFINTNLFIKKSYLVMLGTLLFVFLVSQLYDIKWYIRIIESIFVYLILAISEVVLAMILSLFFELDISYTQDNIILYAICTLSSKFMSFIVVQIFKIKNVKLNGESSLSMVLKLISLPISSFWVLILFLRCCYQIDEKGFQIITLISTIALIISNAFVFQIIEKQDDYYSTKEKLDFAHNHIYNQISHYNELYKYQKELRTFRHDTQNSIISLLAHMEKGEYSKAISSLKNNLSMLEMRSKEIVSTGNPVLDAILQSKYSIAKNKGIEMDISARLNQNIQIDELEFGVMIGNALDNAIEATERIEFSKRTPIFVSIITVDDRISIAIKNSAEGKIDLAKLSSSKKDKHNHGYGLNSIRSIAYKYGGYVDISYEQNIFSININLANYK